MVSQSCAMLFRERFIMNSREMNTRDDPLTRTSYGGHGQLHCLSFLDCLFYSVAMDVPRVGRQRWGFIITAEKPPHTVYQIYFRENDRTMRPGMRAMIGSPSSHSDWSAKKGALITTKHFRHSTDRNFISSDRT